MAIDRRGYRKVYKRLWRNHDFRTFPDREKVLTLYLLTGPQTNRVGLYSYSMATAAEDLGWSLDSLRARQDRVLAAFKWIYDDKARVIYLPTWWEFNPPGEHEKTVKGLLSDLNDVPKTVLIHQFCRNLTHVPEVLWALFQGWETPLTPSEHAPSTLRARSQRDRVRTRDITETVTETDEHAEGTAPDGAGAAQADGKAIHEFIKGFIDLYAKEHHGAKYPLAHAKHIPLIRRLLKLHSVDRLLKIALVLQRTDDDWIAGTDRGIDILSTKAAWLDQRLCEAEAQHRRTA